MFRYPPSAPCSQSKFPVDDRGTPLHGLSLRGDFFNFRDVATLRHFRSERAPHFMAGNDTASLAACKQIISIVFMRIAPAFGFRVVIAIFISVGVVLRFPTLFS